MLAREAKVSHDGEARKKAKAEKAAREKDQIEKWVSENAPDEMKDRFAAGVLDRDEVLDANARSGLRMPWSSPECILGNANSVSRKPKEPGSWSGLLSGSSSFPVSIGYRNKEALYGHRIPNN